MEAVRQEDRNFPAQHYRPPEPAGASPYRSHGRSTIDEHPRASSRRSMTTMVLMMTMLLAVLVLVLVQVLVLHGPPCGGGGPSSG